MTSPFSIFFFAVAILAALSASFLPVNMMPYFTATVRFFEIMIPFLGVGALAKYLMD